jgi:hypothetical protein
LSAQRSYAALPLAIAGEIQPRTDLTVSEWADKFRVVPPGTSPEPGAWRTDRVPYLREILDAFASDPTVERVYIQAASQIGKSEILLSVIGYYAHQEPAPILLVQSTELAMRGFSKERVGADVRRVARAARQAERRRARSEQHDHAAPVSRRLARVRVGGLGGVARVAPDPRRARRRARPLARHDGARRRSVRAGGAAHEQLSQPQDPRGVDADRRVVLGDRAAVRRQRSAALPRPVSALRGAASARVVGRHLQERRRRVDLDDVHYRCAHCAERIDERHKPAMLAEGEWRAEREHRNRGYQISAIYSPWVRWRELAAEWIKATPIATSAGCRSSSTSALARRGPRKANGSPSRRLRKTASCTTPRCPTACSSSPPASTCRTTDSRPRSSDGVSERNRGGSRTP